MDALRIGPIKKLSPEERIDTEKALDRAQRRVRDLVSRLNSTNLAVMLPAETLLEIFMYLKALWEEDTLDEAMGFGSQGDNIKHLSWTLVVGVCTRWRSVALGAPTLWAKIRLLNPADVDMAIERSKNMLLNVEGPLPTESSEHILKAWQFVSPYSDRICSLSINNIYDAHSPQDDELDAFYFGPFLKLKTLQISLNSFRDIKLWIPFFLFAALCKSPALESLKAYSLDLPSLQQLISPNLRHLELHDLPSENVTSHTVYQGLLGVLRELSQLETLELHDSLPYIEFDTRACTSLDDIPLVFDKPVNMPNLSSVQLEQTHLMKNTPALTMALFLRHLALPRSASVEIQSAKYTLSELSLLLSSPRARVPPSEGDTTSTPLTARTLAIHDCHKPFKYFPCHVMLACWAQELPVALTGLFCLHKPEPPSLHPEEDCILTVSIPNYAGQLTLEDVISRVSIPPLRCLSLSSNEPTSDFCKLTKGSRLMLETATEVSTLVVQSAWTEKLPEILSHDSASPLLFPKLQTIYIVDHALPDSCIIEDDADTSTITAHDSWMLRLLHVLESDRAGAERLKRIFVIRSKEFSSKDIAGLRMYANEVICE